MLGPTFGLNGRNGCVKDSSAINVARGTIIRSGHLAVRTPPRQRQSWLLPQTSTATRSTPPSHAKWLRSHKPGGCPTSDEALTLLQFWLSAAVPVVAANKKTPIEQCILRSQPAFQCYGVSFSPLINLRRVNTIILWRGYHSAQE